MLNVNSLSDDYQKADLKVGLNYNNDDNNNNNNNNNNYVNTARWWMSL